LGAFATTHDGKLRQLLQAHADDRVNILLSQPECVVLFELLDADEFSLADACRDLPDDWIEPVRAAWGGNV
jgi:hypothetical protein